jgi:polygalacturonase
MVKNFTNAADFGLSAGSTGTENQTALQAALDMGGTVIVSAGGVYPISGTVYIGGNTELILGSNVFLKKVNENGDFSHVILNKGAKSKTYDEHITIKNLQIIVNGVDARKFEIFGLHGQLAFFYVKDLRIEGFRCMDLGKWQYGIHICTFYDVIIDGAIIKGGKDGIHFGRGKRFTVRDCVFETYDDAIALNAHDYDVGNPELGWIENGVIMNCHDLNDSENRPPIGYFCRVLAGGWIDWFEGIRVRKSDTVVSGGRLYRVSAQPDGTIYISRTMPSHESGSAVLDGIEWIAVQNGVTYTAGVRNVSFQNIFLEKPRPSAFSFHFDDDIYSRSYYPGADVPMQERLRFDNIYVLFGEKTDLFSVYTPIDTITISGSDIGNCRISFYSNDAVTDYKPTVINMYGCVSGAEILVNNVPDKKIIFHKTANIEK